MPHPVRSALVVLLASTILNGCADGGSEPDAAESSSGTQAVEVSDAGVAFALPDDWVELDPDDAREAAADPELMAELVERHGPDTEDHGPVHLFISTTAVPVSGVDPLFVASDQGVTDGVLPQLTVEVRPAADLPAAAELEQHHRDSPLGSSYVEVTEVDTDIGPALVEAYATDAEDPLLHWARLLVDLGSEAMTITVVTGDRATSYGLASSIAASLSNR